MKSAPHLRFIDVDNFDTPTDTPKKCASFLVRICGKFDRENARLLELFF